MTVSTQSTEKTELKSVEQQTLQTILVSPPLLNKTMTYGAIPYHWYTIKKTSVTDAPTRPGLSFSMKYISLWLMCPHGTQTNDSCAMHCKPKHMKTKSVNQNVNELFKMVSFDTTFTCLNGCPHISSCLESRQSSWWLLPP